MHVYKYFLCIDRFSYYIILHLLFTNESAKNAKAKSELFE